jgi:hypothetical protein
MVSPSVYDEVADFMASMNPSKVVAFKPSKTNQSRYEDLVQKNELGTISENEKNDLEHFLMLNRIIGLAKARAFDPFG